MESYLSVFIWIRKINNLKSTFAKQDPLSLRTVRHAMPESRRTVRAPTGIRERCTEHTRPAGSVPGPRDAAFRTSRVPALARGQHLGYYIPERWALCASILSRRGEGCCPRSCTMGFAFCFMTDGEQICHGSKCPSRRSDGTLWFSPPAQGFTPSLRPCVCAFRCPCRWFLASPVFLVDSLQSPSLAGATAWVCACAPLHFLSPWDFKLLQGGHGQWLRFRAVL